VVRYAVIGRAKFQITITRGRDPRRQIKAVETGGGSQNEFITSVNPSKPIIC